MSFMQKGYSLFLALLFLAHVLAGQTSIIIPNNSQSTTAPPEKPVAQPAPPQQATEASNFTSAKGFVLEEATPVKLRFSRTVSSADAHTGDTVDFEVLQAISVNGTLVIAKGGLAVGTVTDLSRSEEWRGEADSRLTSTMSNWRTATGQPCAR